MDKSIYDNSFYFSVERGESFFLAQSKDIGSWGRRKEEE